MKKLILLITIVILCVCIAGCGLFERDYTVITDYNIEYSSSGSDEDKLSVKDIKELSDAVLSVIENYGEISDTIIFEQDYSGDPHTDMAAVCKQISTNPVCAYCVESLSYDIYKVPTYYEAAVHVVFVDSAEDIGNIVQLSYGGRLAETISEAIHNFDTRLVVVINHCSYSDYDVRAMVYDYYYAYPLCVPFEPNVSVNMYSSSGNQRLFEINIDYNATYEELVSFNNYISDFKSSFECDKAFSDLEKVEYACAYIIQNCSLSQSTYETSAYYAFKQGSATNKGLSLALLSICNENDIECMLVSGTRAWNNHFWNIVNIDGSYYHIDIQSCITDSIESGFLLSDDKMWETYRWNLPEYPECNSIMKYDAADLYNIFDASKMSTEENND